MTERRLPILDTSGPPQRVERTGVPHANASAAGAENVSTRLGSTNKSACRMNSATSALLLEPWNVTMSPSFKSAASRS